ncbi:MAG: hypothetical protein ACTHKT_14280 [Solirubrobacterales bacterium]
MHKKLMLACMAIAAFAAFVIAPVASATPVLTEGTTAVAVGSSIKGTNTGATKFTASTGTVVECSHAEFKGTVTKNSGTKITGEIPAGSSSFSGSAAESKCTSGLGAVSVSTGKLCLETAASDAVTVTGCGANVTFVLTIAGIECPYATASVSGTYSTTGDATVNVSEQTATRSNSNVFCPASGKIDMDFDLTTTAGTTLTVS